MQDLISLTKEQLEEIIKTNNNSFFIICASSGILRSKDCAAYISISEESAKKYFDSIINDLPAELRNFSALKMENVEDIYSFSGFFNGETFKYINFIDFGIAIKDIFINKNLDLVKTKNWTSKEEVIEKAKSVWNKEKLYIILSTQNANLEKNTSIPYIVDSNPYCLWIFEEYEAAKKFIDRNNKQKPNGKYPIGIIDNSKVIWNLKTTLSIASALNIPDIEINPEEYECIHFSIAEFFEINNEKLITSFSALTPENSDKIDNGTLSFNPFSFDF